MLTQDILKEHLHYCPDTGHFTWIKKPGRSTKVGEIAGTVHPDYGYRYITIKRKKYRAHRLAVLYMSGSFPLEVVDHINRCRDDNRWANLACVSQRENSSKRPDKNDFVGVKHNKKTNMFTATYKIGRHGTENYRAYSKTFSGNKYGNTEAYRMACAARLSFEARDKAGEL